MSSKTQYCQNALLCLAAVGMAALWSTRLINEDTFDQIKVVMDIPPDIPLGVTRFALYVFAGTALLAAGPFVYRHDLNKKKKWNDLVNSIGCDEEPKNKWKDIPQVY